MRSGLTVVVFIDEDFRVSLKFLILRPASAASAVFACLPPGTLVPTSAPLNRQSTRPRATMVRTRTPSPVTLEDAGDSRADSVMGRDKLCAQIWKLTQTGHITHIKPGDVPGLVGTSSAELEGELGKVIASIGRPKFDSIVRGVTEPWAVFKETEKARRAAPATPRIAKKTLKKRKNKPSMEAGTMAEVGQSKKPAPAKKRRATPDEDEDDAEGGQKKPAAKPRKTKRRKSEDKWNPSDAAALVRALGGGTWSPPSEDARPAAAKGAAAKGGVPKMLYTRDDHDNINMVHIIMRRDIIEVSLGGGGRSNRALKCMSIETNLTSRPNLSVSKVFEADHADARRIGIRCKFCKHLPAKERENLHSIYPEKIGGIYRACTVRFKKHMAQCEHIPGSVHRELRKHDASARGSKIYW